MFIAVSLKGQYSMLEKSTKPRVKELRFGTDSASTFLCDFGKVTPPCFPYLAFKVLTGSKVKGSCE